MTRQLNNRLNFLVWTKYMKFALNAHRLYIYSHTLPDSSKLLQIDIINWLYLAISFINREKWEQLFKIWDYGNFHI